MGSIAVGLDIGHKNIKIVELRKASRKPIMTACEMVPTPPGAIENGMVTQPGELENAITEAFSLSAAGRKNICVLISGVGLDIRMIEIPKMPEKERENPLKWELKDVAVIYKDTPIEDIIIDFHTVKEDDDYTKVFVVSAKKPYIYSYLNVLNSIKIRPKIFDLGVLNLPWLYGDLKDDPEVAGGHCYVNMGYNSIQLLVMDNDRCEICRILTGGGKVITEAYARMKGVDMQEAEIQKHQKSLDSLMNSEGESKANFVSVLNRSIDGILQSIEYGRQQRRLTSVQEFLASMMVSGGEMKIHGFSDLLSDELDIPVVKTNPFEAVQLSSKLDMEYCHDLAEFIAPAVGVCIRGLDEL